MNCGDMDLQPLQVNDHCSDVTTWPPYDLPSDGGYLQPRDVAHGAVPRTKSDHQLFTPDRFKLASPESTSRRRSGGSRSEWTDCPGSRSTKKQPVELDNVAFKGHDYEELPATGPGLAFLSNDYLHASEAPAPASVPNAMAITHPPAVTSNRQFRKRENPLYDSALPNKKDLQTAPGAVGGTSVCCVALTGSVLIVLAVAALVISIVSIVIASETDAALRGPLTTLFPNASSSQELAMKLRHLEDDLQILRSQWSGISDMLNTSLNDESVVSLLLMLNNSTMTINSLSDKISSLQTVTSVHASLITELNRSQDILNNSVASLASLQTTQNAELGRRLGALRDELSARIDNVTKMVGPQGPAGSGNMSACTHRIVNAGTAAVTFETSTNQVDMSSGELRSWVITGIQCTTYGGTQAFLSFNSNTPDRYQCVCRGMVNSSTVTRHCEMHFWLCPRIS